MKRYWDTILSAVLAIAVSVFAIHQASPVTAWIGGLGLGLAALQGFTKHISCVIAEISADLKQIVEGE